MPPPLRPRTPSLWPLTAIAALSLAALGCGGETTAPTPDAGPSFHYAHDGELRLNHLQVKGTHNSYHVAQPDAIKALAYTHAPLDVQFQTEGVRQIELDINFNYLKKVFEVYHIAIADEGTTCRLFTDCLKTVKAWSDKNPAHHTLFIHIEPKDSPSQADAESFFKSLEAEVLSVFPRDRVVTPDDVKGSAASLREALIGPSAKGWPTLGEGRGKVLFYVDNASDFRAYYTHGMKDLAGRLLFVDSDSTLPFAAVVIANDPMADAQKIADSSKAGLIVRTRADADNVEPFAGDTTHREEALKSGAHFVSTDYPEPVMGVNYVVQLPGGTPSRCNPLTAPSFCTSADIEDPKQLHP
jgi:Phosphoinositide phospholipase C, Ca2+-dependent